MPDPVSVRFEGSFEVTHLENGKHTFLLTLPDSISIHIGQIVVYWGAFEVRMDALLGSILDGMSYESPPGWRKLGFRKRKELFRDTMRQYTGDMFPHLTDAFDQIAATAADLHWRRNIIAHGYYEATPDGVVDEKGEQGVAFTAIGEVKGKRQSIKMDVTALQKLWHDIAHLNGELLANINQMGGKLSSLDVVIPDTDFLQGRESGNFRLLAISQRA